MSARSRATRDLPRAMSRRCNHPDHPDVGADEHSQSEQRFRQWCTAYGSLDEAFDRPILVWFW